MQYQHIIWDWNGTLFNDLPLCIEITNELLAAHLDQPLSPVTFREKLTHPMIDFYRAVVGEISDEQYALFSETFHVQYKERRHSCSLQEHSRSLLEGFRQKKVRQSILSAHPQHLLNEIVNHLKISHLFDDVVGAKDSLAGSKIDAGIELMGRNASLCESILLVGDTDHDADVAKALKIDCILIAHGFQSRERLERCGFPVFESLNEAELHISQNTALS